MNTKEQAAHHALMRRVFPCAGCASRMTAENQEAACPCCGAEAGASCSAHLDRAEAERWKLEVIGESLRIGERLLASWIGQAAPDTGDA